jgi:hypothetical protein
LCNHGERSVDLYRKISIQTNLPKTHHPPHRAHRKTPAPETSACTKEQHKNKEPTNQKNLHLFKTTMKKKISTNPRTWRNGPSTPKNKSRRNKKTTLTIKAKGRHQHPKGKA